MGEEDLYDPSRRAEKILEYVIQEDAAGAEQAQSNEVDVARARTAEQVLEVVDLRATSRVLFVTTDTSVLVANSAAQRAYIGFEHSFDEVHVMVLAAQAGKEDGIRCGDRTWLYPVRHKYWWFLPLRARSVAKEVLVFHDSIRPDIVVGVDPFEAGLAAYLIAAMFDRPLQLHLVENFLDESYRTRNEDNGWRLRIAKYLLKRVESVRTATSRLKEGVKGRFKKIDDLEVLPKFYDFSGYLNATPAFDIHDKYRQFSFIMLAFGDLTATSSLHDTFTALHNMLHNPRIGLVIIGSGPAKTLFEEKAGILGVKESVVFVERPEDIAAFLLTADLLVETSVSPDSDSNVMRAAAAGLPIVAYETELRKDLFQEGVTAYLCPPGDTQGVFQKSTKLVNAPALRKQFSKGVRDVARDRLIEDPTAYYRAYRDSVEVVLDTIPEEAPEPVPQGQEMAADGRIVGEDGMSYPAGFGQKE